MFLKSLDIFGFKSFADRTRIEFSSGITALLGPNGCGKSNVVDAIKWVLGEQASRSLRAEKMEDVIFNGTENRKPLNYAEVTLTLANEEGLLPIDMPEIQIMRRLHRSGESEYLINQNPVRLKEIRELFWDTGVGKVAYSVMEQGKIDQVLSSRPDERRYLFEEAAGITRFKQRGQEAERKLLRTEENMRQVEGILGEVKRSYDSLKVQSEKTISYRELREDIFNFELDIQLLRLKTFRNERESRSEDVERFSKRRDEVRGNIDSINHSLEEHMDQVNSMESQLIERQKRIYGLAVEKNAKEKEAKQVAEQRTDCISKIQMNENRKRAVEEKIEELLEDIGVQDTYVQDLKKRLEATAKNIASFEENINHASLKIGENERKVREAEEEIQRLEKKRLSTEEDLEGLTENIVKELDERLSDKGYSLQELKHIEGDLEEALGRVKTSLQGREDIASDLLRSLEHGADSSAPLNIEEIKKIVKSLFEVLSEGKKELQRIEGLFQNYRDRSPTFLEDFLSPTGIITQKRSLDAELRSTRERVEGEREKIQNLRAENEQLLEKIDEYRKTLEDLRLTSVRMSTQAQAAEEQARLIRRELAGQEGLLKTIEDEIFLEQKRLEDLDERISEAESEIAEMEVEGRRLTEDLENLEREIARSNSDVLGKREKLKSAMEMLERVQGQLERVHMSLVQNETEIRTVQEHFRETHSRDLLEFEERMYTIARSAQDLREDLARARASLRELGSVNLMAPEEFAETKERYDFLNGQLEDLKKAREDLENITKEIRAESSELFIVTYNKIKKNFHNMFRRLFGGGRAELRLSDPNHVLESGIEIFAQPPGKKLENINLLSGGERSMTAVALLFATYMVKPSPFCLLDEIDAALDDSNVARFVQLLREFGASSQFIVITHNKKTVTGAQTLLGVTMEEFGVTKVIAVRLESEDAARLDPFADVEPFEEEEVEPEYGYELPPDIDDPALVKESDLRPIRAARLKADGEEEG